MTVPAPGQAIAIRLVEEGVDVAINYVGAWEGAEATREAIEHSHIGLVNAAWAIDQAERARR